MKCIIYTDHKADIDVSVRGVDIKVIYRKDLKFINQFTYSLDWRNKSLREKILNWYQVGYLKKTEDITGVIVRARDYGIRRGLHGIARNTNFQVFHSRNKRLNDDIKHEILHCVANKLRKPRVLHQWLRDGKSLEDFEDFLFPKVKGLLPHIQKKWETFELVMSFIDPIKMVEGYRTYKRQNDLYAQGRTKSGKIVTNAKGGESLHNYGRAIDYRFVKKPIYPKSGAKRWLLANVIAKAVGFESYGLKYKWDDGHIQILDGQTEKDIIS